jgi:hypothetical protein
LGRIGQRRNGFGRGNSRVRHLALCVAA